MLWQLLGRVERSSLSTNEYRSVFYKDCAAVYIRDGFDGSKTSICRTKVILFPVNTKVKWFSDMM